MDKNSTDLRRQQ